MVRREGGRHSIGSTTEGLKKADGSITIYIQKDNPGTDKQSNWLPAPAGSFNLTMRLDVQIEVANAQAIKSLWKIC
jgi:hypothetical protein